MFLTDVSWKNHSCKDDRWVSCKRYMHNQQSNVSAFKQMDTMHHWNMLYTRGYQVMVYFVNAILIDKSISHNFQYIVIFIFFC